MSQAFFHVCQHHDVHGLPNAKDEVLREPAVLRHQWLSLGAELIFSRPAPAYAHAYMITELMEMDESWTFSASLRHEALKALAHKFTPPDLTQRGLEQIFSRPPWPIDSEYTSPLFCFSAHPVWPWLIHHPQAPSSLIRAEGYMLVLAFLMPQNRLQNESLIALHTQEKNAWMSSLTPEEVLRLWVVTSRLDDQEQSLLHVFEDQIQWLTAQHPPQFQEKILLLARTLPLSTQSQLHELSAWENFVFRQEWTSRQLSFPHALQNTSPPSFLSETSEKNEPEKDEAEKDEKEGSGQGDMNTQSNPSEKQGNPQGEKQEDGCCRVRKL